MRAFLTVQGVAKAFGGVRALDGLDLVLEAGQLLCIIGPNGCGKTTLLRVLSGELVPDSGRMLLDGLALEGLAPHRVARLGIARKLQTPGIWPELSVRDHLEVALFARAGASAFSASPRPGDVATRPSSSPSRVSPGMPSSRRASLRTVPSNGSRWRCCSRRGRSFCCSTSRPPA